MSLFLPCLKLMKPFSEEAVEILGRGDKESARNLLRQAGIELLDSPGDLSEQGGVRIHSYNFIFSHYSTPFFM